MESNTAYTNHQYRYHISLGQNFRLVLPVCKIQEDWEGYELFLGRPLSY